MYFTIIVPGNQYYIAPPVHIMRYLFKMSRNIFDIESIEGRYLQGYIVIHYSAIIIVYNYITLEIPTFDAFYVKNITRHFEKIPHNMYWWCNVVLVHTLLYTMMTITIRIKCKQKGFNFITAVINFSHFRIGRQR